MIWYTNSHRNSDILTSECGCGYEFDFGSMGGSGWGDGMVVYTRGGEGVIKTILSFVPPLIYYF